MNELFSFLNQQNVDRLIGYSFVFLVSLYLITECVSVIFRSAFAAIRRSRVEKPKTEK